MAEGKKSFILYCDIINIFAQLSDKEAGLLIKHILGYVNDQNPKLENRILKMAFEPIKLQLKRDLNKWGNYIEKQRSNGKLGGRPKKIKETQKTQPFFDKPKKADNANVTVNVNDTVIYDAEQEILKNEIWLETQCMKHSKTLQEGKEILHTYHLYLEEKENYPRGKKSVFSGFEKWLINEKKFNNGHSTNQKSGKHTGALQLVKSLKEDYARRK